jgi:predicted HD superfamily hydrolase involved in NAD metabolism
MTSKKMMDIQKWLKTQVSSYRYRHIGGVAKAAARLALYYKLPIDKAVTAAWLHDCAKELPKDEMKKWIGRSPYKLDALEKKMPALWHPHAGAAIARKKWGIKDPSVIEAIRCHTLGSPAMKPLAQLLFVADFIEPLRRFDGVAEARVAAMRGLRDAICTKARMTIEMMLRNGILIHPRLLETWSAFLPQKGNGDKVSVRSANRA